MHHLIGIIAEGGEAKVLSPAHSSAAAKPSYEQVVQTACATVLSQFRY